MTYHKARPVPSNANRGIAYDEQGRPFRTVDGMDELLWRLPTYSGAK